MSGSNSAAETHPTDVVVAGAGPTGLMAALLLARNGVSVRIIDKSASAAKESRAFAVQARTLEIMLSVGLADAFLDRGMIASGASLHVDGRPAAGLNLGSVARSDTPYPIVLILAQAETEAVLVDALRREGVTVERGVVATTLAQDEAGVTVRTTLVGGGESSIRASYVIGADGAHSMVRKALGLTFEGAAYGQSFLLADCTVEGPIETSPFSVFFHRNQFALWFPMKGERFGRVITTSADAMADPSVATQGTAPATLAEVEASFRGAAQLDLRLSNPVWTSRYRVHHRGVNRYGIGRVFVAGDAAHIHSPAGGQGMNTGLQDAANLAWKLALAVKGGAPPALLESYDGERRPIGDKVLRATDRAFSLVTSSSSWVAAARDLLLPLVGATLGRSDAIRARMFNLLSELGIRYHPGAAVAADVAGWTEGPSPGRRAPDAVIGRKTSVFDLTAGYRFTLLALSRDALSGLEIAALAEELRVFADQCCLPLAAHLVAHSLIGRDPRIVQIESSAVVSAYGLSDAAGRALYLVRPDGHVAWRSRGFDLAGCRAFASERFGAFRPTSAP